MKTSRPRSRSIRRERGRDQRSVSKLINQKGGASYIYKEPFLFAAEGQKIGLLGNQLMLWEKWDNNFLRFETDGEFEGCDTTINTIN